MHLILYYVIWQPMDYHFWVIYLEGQKPQHSLNSTSLRQKVEEVIKAGVELLSHLLFHWLYPKEKQTFSPLFDRM